MSKKLFMEDGLGFVEILELFGDDLTVVNAARVSFHKESSYENGKLSERDAGLIRYLAKHEHITPFFHPIVRMRIKMPIFVTREWWRSTIGFARNEVSRRYVMDTPDIFVPAKLRMRDQNLKQGSKSEAISENQEYVTQMRDYCKKAQEYYNHLLANDVCPEQARMILPQSMYTEFIETASLAGYARLVNLRVHATAQREIQQYAWLVDTLLKDKFPVSWPALIKSKAVKEHTDEHQTGHVDHVHGKKTQHDRTVL
ncbi:FAD-dependent thymidylate synthase [Candidatus Dependentiae bacterium]